MIQRQKSTTSGQEDIAHCTCPHVCFCSVVAEDGTECKTCTILISLTPCYWLTCPIVDQMLLKGGVLRYLHGCQAGPIQFNQLRSWAFCRKFPRCHRKLMDSVTVGDLSIFQIEIGYGHKYIYTHILHHSFSVSWLICVPVNAAGLFLPFSRPVMHLRSFRVKANQWFQSTVWSCWNGSLRNTGIARYCRVELEILRLVLGCLLTLDLALNVHLWQTHHTKLQIQTHRVCKDFYVYLDFCPSQHACRVHSWAATLTATWIPVLETKNQDRLPVQLLNLKFQPHPDLESLSCWAGSQDWELWPKRSFLPSQLGRICWESRNALQVPSQDKLAKLAPLLDGGNVLSRTKRLEQRTKSV